MKAIFEDFLKDNKNCSGLKDNNDAREVFDILSEDDNIIKMLEFSDQEQPALAACVKRLKNWHDSKTVNEFPFRTEEGNFNKKAVGRMVKTILAPFGYTVFTRKAISPKYGSDDFSSAACYKRDTGATAKLMVKKVITRVER